MRKSMFCRRQQHHQLVRRLAALKKKNGHGRGRDVNARGASPKSKNVGGRTQGGKGCDWCATRRRTAKSLRKTERQKKVQNQKAGEADRGSTEGIQEATLGAKRVVRQGYSTVGGTWGGEREEERGGRNPFKGITYENLNQEKWEGKAAKATGSGINNSRTGGKLMSGKRAKGNRQRVKKAVGRSQCRTNEFLERQRRRKTGETTGRCSELRKGEKRKGKEKRRGDLGVRIGNEYGGEKKINSNDQRPKRDSSSERSKNVGTIKNVESRPEPSQLGSGPKKKCKNTVARPGFRVAGKKKDFQKTIQSTKKNY